MTSENTETEKNTTSVQVRLPDGLLASVDQKVNNGRSSWSDRTDFIKDAIREKLDRIKNIEDGNIISR
jgi:metal-responsive CopG/Arc/MetJ family transcriptional regulator